MKYIVLIPIYNERESLKELIEKINYEVKDLNSELSIVVINDASSQQIVDTYTNTENINSIEIVNMKQNKGTKSKKEVTAIIDEIVSNLEKNKLLNDEMYSDSKARMFLRRGYSLNKINQSLRSKGIDDKYVKQSIEKIKEDQIEPDFVSALKLCKRRRIGPLRPESNRELFYKKDMGILARGGFSFDLSKRVLDLDANEFKKLIKII